MKRIWFTQQKEFEYMPLRAGLGIISEKELHDFWYFYQGCPELCPKTYTTRTHPLFGEYCVVEGSRFKAKPLEPRIEFRATPICLIDFKNRVFLDVNIKKFFAEWDFFTIDNNEKGYTIFPELDLGIKGATFNELKDELLRLNPKTTIDTLFYVNRLERL